jgi:hypothetical protein
MTIPIQIQTIDDHYVATLVGAEIRAVETTREQALSTIKAAIAEQVLQGQLQFIDMETDSVASLARKYENDPTLEAIGREALYMRERELTA